MNTKLTLIVNNAAAKNLQAQHEKLVTGQINSSVGMPTPANFPILTKPVSTQLEPCT